MSDWQKPWIYGGFKQAMETIMSNEQDATQNQPQSQYKTPYIAEDYPKMEWELDFPGTPLWKPRYGYSPAPDCEVRGDALGGGTPGPCEPGVQCGVWVFSCAHRIKKLSVPQAFGWIQSVQYFANDTVRVTVCWDEGQKGGGKQIGPAALTTTGQSVVSKVDLTCVGAKADCKSCQDCKNTGKKPNLNGWTQQMSTSGKQYLNATGGGGGPYKWTIQKGGGTISPTQTNSGQNTTYTAPSTNPSCNLNPTIRVTDYCGFYTEVKIAVNGWSPANCTGGVATQQVFHTIGGNCTAGVSISFRTKSCNGTVCNTYGCTSCSGGVVPNCCQVPPTGAGACGDCPPSGYPTYTWACNDTCLTAKCTGESPANPCMAAAGPGSCAAGFVKDKRTGSMKSGGCCPADLL